MQILPCLDSDELAAARRRELYITRAAATALGISAVDAAEAGAYLFEGTRVDWRASVEAAISAKVSIPPDAPLPTHGAVAFPETVVQVTNETTTAASKRLLAAGHRPLALNFANGVSPGGGFLHGALAQEEAISRSSALYSTLVGDRMYDVHRKRTDKASSDWTIYSPGVPIFRADDGTELPEPWLLDFLTCAAPYAHTVGQPESGDLLERRIHRVLAIARAYGYETLVLGAWGCGAFGNDPKRTAVDFRKALENEFEGAFSHVVFAITDWSPERRFLGPFRDAFAS
ncbi:MAG: TIGR02452 family protein [Acidobacteria bacterium]|nr:TIGR02452 family protein [Acidobacteriota bacterium]